MRFSSAFTGVLLVLAAASSCLAETAYVTDNLRLGLHRAADTSDRSFRSLQSGQQLEILDRNTNYANVELPDGTRGYVKANYLVFDKPARLIVAETQARVEELEGELAETREAFAVPGATIASLEQQLAESQAALQTSQSEVAELTTDNENYRRRHDQFKYSLPISWVLTALLVCLVAGFLSAMWWTDHRNRKRHGGIRVH